MELPKIPVGKFRAKFVELYRRYIPLAENKDESIYYNGENNLYPNEIELAILNSPSGKAASKVFAKYISGKGVEDDYIVNPEKNYKLSKIVRMSATDVSRQYGTFFHIGQQLEDGILKPTLDVLEYTKSRIGKEDDSDYISKYWLKDCSIEKKSFGSKSKESVAEWYYPFNNNSEVVLAQIKADYLATEPKETEVELAIMLPYYRGQVHYMNLTPEFKYALSPFDACYNDLDSEYRVSMFTNRNVRTGFLGKTYVITSGLDTEEDKQVDEDIAKWLGSENIGGTYHLSLEAGAEVDKVFKVGQVKAEFDDKLFSETKTTLRDNIYSQANNVPSQLVKAETSIFGTQSETYLEMKKFYTEQTQDERKEIEDTLNYLGFPCKIIPIVDISVKEVFEGVQEVVVDDATKQAQANLRGSVGGVTGVLQVQTSFSQGMTDYNSAITIFTEIYGFTMEVADALLGSPEKIDPNESTTTTI